MLQSTESIGSLDRRVTFIQEIIAIGDANSEEIEGWEEIAVTPTVWARRDEKIGSEVAIADQLSSEQATNWKIRYRGDLNIKMRLVFDQLMYEITSITEVGTARKGYLNITTSLIYPTQLFT